MRLGTHKQQPRERINVRINYEQALDPDDVIEKVFPAEVVLDSPFASGLCTLGALPLLVSDDAVRLWIIGGDNGGRYKVTYRVLTRRGERFEDELRVRIKEL
jgi:hypothetical protein